MTFIVRGSHGNITVDRTTGMVIHYDQLCRCGDDYDHIVRFDPTDIAREGGTETDILALGFWTDKGDYAPALTQRIETNPRWGEIFDDWVEFKVLPAPSGVYAHG